MSMDVIVPSVLVILIGGAFLLDALLPEKPQSRSPHVPPATWPDYLGETDLPPVPVAQVHDVPALWGEVEDVVTGEVVEPEPHRIEPNIRRLGAGR